MWNPGSLKGRGRGHAVIVHTVGSLKADPAKGLSYDTLNFVSARNVANMAVNSGVPHMALLSSVRTPWVSGGYIHSKREAEQYIGRVGLRPTIIRAPIAYARGRRRPLFYQFMTLLGSIPPLSWTWFGRVAPIAVDVLARGVARIVLEDRPGKTIYYARDLRRRNTRQEMSRPVAFSPSDATQQQYSPLYLLDDESPFGWTPPRE